MVKRLSYLLTHSFYAKLLAVRRVTQNKGRKTAGVDGILWNTTDIKIKAAISLTDRKYKAKPLKRVYIEKYGKKEKRPLGIPTMYDRAMQALYTLALDPYAEATADTKSFGFRKFRSAKHSCAMIFPLLAKKASPQWILEGDIKGCFDNISHEWLLEHVPMDKSILKQFLNAGYVFNHNLFQTVTGTPQGGIISPILANITLDGIEELLNTKYHVSKTGHYCSKIAAKSQIYLVRYCDDFIVTSRTREFAEEVKIQIEDFLKERGLELSKEKTKITHIKEGFDFLGWNFRKYRNEKLLIKPSKKSIQKVIDKIGNIIDIGKTWTQKQLIKHINSITIGWANYHKGVVSKEIFNGIDSKMWFMLWDWAKRRHPQKARKWIASKYWHAIDTRKWVFSTEDDLRLSRLAEKKIIRTTPIKLDKNPYIDNDYWQKYKFQDGSRNLTGMFKKIWEKQRGVCPFCNQIIDISKYAEERPVHHIDGNRDNQKLSNLVYTHIHCHQQIHATKSIRCNNRCPTQGL